MIDKWNISTSHAQAKLCVHEEQAMKIFVLLYFVLISGTLCLENNNNNETPLQPNGGFVDENGPTGIVLGQLNQTQPISLIGNSDADTGNVNDEAQQQVPLYQLPGQLNPNRQPLPQGHQVPNLGSVDVQEQRSPQEQNVNNNSSASQYLNMGLQNETPIPILVQPVTLSQNQPDSGSTSNPVTATPVPVVSEGRFIGSAGAGGPADTTGSVRISTWPDNTVMHTVPSANGHFQLSAPTVAGSARAESSSQASYSTVLSSHSPVQMPTVAGATRGEYPTQQVQRTSQPSIVSVGVSLRRTESSSGAPRTTVSSSLEPIQIPATQSSTETQASQAHTVAIVESVSLTAIQQTFPAISLTTVPSLQRPATTTRVPASSAAPTLNGHRTLTSLTSAGVSQPAATPPTFSEIFQVTSVRNIPSLSQLLTHGINHQTTPTFQRTQGTVVNRPRPTEEKTLDPRDNETQTGPRTTLPDVGEQLQSTRMIIPTPSSSWTSSPSESIAPSVIGTREVPTRATPTEPTSLSLVNSLQTEVTPTLSRLQSSVVVTPSESVSTSTLKTQVKISDKPVNKTTTIPALSRTYDISPTTSVSMTTVVSTTLVSTQYNTPEMEIVTVGTISEAVTTGMDPSITVERSASEETPTPSAEPEEIATSTVNQNSSEANTTISRRETSSSTNISSVYNTTEGPALATRPKTTQVKRLSLRTTKIVVPKTTGAVTTTTQSSRTSTTPGTVPGISLTYSTRTESASATPPLASDIPLYIRVSLEMTWNDFCQSHNHFRRELVDIIERNGKVIRKEQVIFLDAGQAECLNDPVQVSEDIMISLYISDKDGQYNAVLTEEVGQVIEEGFKSSTQSHFKDKVKEVTIVGKRPPEQAQPVEPVEPGVTIAIIIASVGGICCVILLLLQFVLRRRHGRKMTAFVPGTRQFSIRSVDSIALNTVKSRPHSGLFNPGLDSGEVVCQSHPVNFAGLANFTADVEPLYEQFQLLPNDVPSLSDVPVGCEEKNRYANVLPFTETRVRLSVISKELTCDYINANYLTGYKEKCRAYIATQAPLECTIVDFWRMIWEQQNRAIIMLTPLEEHGLSKCAEYWPDTEGVDTKRLYGDYQVELKKKEIQPEYIVSTLVLKYMDRNLTREIKHLWFTNWPQSNNPDPATLIKFIHQIRPYYEEYSSPVVVHCSPGTGRTGTLIAIDICMRMYEDTRTVDILKCVSEMRHERSGVVQTREQYALIYKALNEYASQLNSPVPSQASSSISLQTL